MGDLTPEEVEAILNSSQYMPPSQWPEGSHGKEGLSLVCPNCGVRETFFSGLLLAWQCIGCDYIFDQPEGWEATYG